ncbi:hypothetical protein L1987_02799 [Smallanthus sonchifolius]|uniref:Uncharacterized protein n=1 Tax=Smallanthus sonchifolius TaxID=185202 RepID=A0ACB9K8Q4_9ASTR|nr:hypothetical protein L1987_02799 [Smallanthus sonchifolius]
MLISNNHLDQKLNGKGLETEEREFYTLKPTSTDYKHTIYNKYTKEGEDDDNINLTQSGFYDDTVNRPHKKEIYNQHHGFDPKMGSSAKKPWNRNSKHHHRIESVVDRLKLLEEIHTYGDTIKCGNMDKRFEKVLNQVVNFLVSKILLQDWRL